MIDPQPLDEQQLKRRNALLAGVVGLVVLFMMLVAYWSRPFYYWEIFRPAIGQ